MLAYASKIIPERLDSETGKRVRVGTPDSVQVLTTQEDGSIGVYRLSGVLHHAPGLGVTLYGSEGTLKYDLTRDEIRGAKRSAAALAPLPIPDESARRLASRGGFHRRHSWRARRDSYHVRHRRPLHAIHRGRRPQFAASTAGHVAAQGVLESELVRDRVRTVPVASRPGRFRLRSPARPLLLVASKRSVETTGGRRSSKVAANRLLPDAARTRNSA